MGINEPKNSLTNVGESLDFEALVEKYYAALFRFGLSLTQNEAEASDLTQQTFYLWAMKGHQLRDASKVKSWLFTTLHHEFLGLRRHETRFPHFEISEMNEELPNIAPNIVDEMDSITILKALMQVDELYRAPLTLFYLEHHPYHEIAEILGAPIGTIMSRLARGKQQLRQILADTNKKTEEKIISLPREMWRTKHE